MSLFMILQCLGNPALLPVFPGVESIMTMPPKGMYAVLIYLANVFVYFKLEKPHK